MVPDAPGGAPEPRKEKRFAPPLKDIKARQMGELARGESRWDVLLETVRDPEVDALRGRIHFISGNLHRLSGWIFLEWAEKDVETRFGEFSAQELWNLLDSLG
jgi:hypothetical protein